MELHHRLFGNFLARRGEWGGLCRLGRLGNLAAHSHKPLQQLDSMTAVRELFHVCFWLARTYGKAAKPADGVTFNPVLLSRTSPVPPQTLAQLQQLETQLAEKDTKLTELLTGKAALDAELERLRA